MHKNEKRFVIAADYGNGIAIAIAQSTLWIVLEQLSFITRIEMVAKSKASAKKE